MLFLISLLLELVRLGILNFLQLSRLKKQKSGVSIKRSGPTKIPTEKDITIKRKGPFKIVADEFVDVVQSKRDYNKILDIFENLTPKQWNQVRKAIWRGTRSNNWKLRDQFDEFIEQVNYIATRKIKGRPLTKNQTRILNIAKKMLLDKHGTFTYNPLKSSWLIACAYVADKRVMWVKMVRGTTIYRFVNVPPEAYIAIIVLSGHAGTYWWKEWFWRYSTNQARWKGIKKQRRKK